MIYRGHEIRLEGGRYKTFSPSAGYNGSFDSSGGARRWIREQRLAEPSEVGEWVYTSEARKKCEACGEWIYTRRRTTGGPSAFPPECQVCGAASAKETDG